PLQGSANEAPEIPDNVGDWLQGVYHFATNRNDFRRNLILNLGLFAAGVWLARNLSDIDLSLGCSHKDTWNSCAVLKPSKNEASNL
ncbi:mitochondrial import receptor subunit TOM6 homolog, partial [Balaenoptera ricei]|uniref:mitochondrial import receptor subunit TOM6 homolog n=1 Tax=Balaenoptera ricei TaxID=2746895 RepID=UPI0028BEE11F